MRAGKSGNKVQYLFGPPADVTPFFNQRFICRSKTHSSPIFAAPMNGGTHFSRFSNLLSCQTSSTNRKSVFGGLILYAHGSPGQNFQKDRQNPFYSSHGIQTSFHLFNPNVRKVGALVAKIIAIVNQKGGVGKTTTCVNLAAFLTEAGKHVLLCDFDPQANATSGMGVDKTVSKGIYSALIGELPPQEVIVHTRYGDVLPSNKALAGAGVELIGMEHREFLLKEALSSLKEKYDFVLIDCPPSLELLTLNALCAADSILVPVQCEYFALEGLSDLMNTIRLVRRSLNPSLELEGVLLTMFDGRTNLALQVAEEVKHYFPGKVYASVIPRNIRLSEAPSHGKPISAYDRASRGADAYLAFVSEFLK